MTAKTMKAGLLRAMCDIRYEDIEKPVPRRDQVLIKVKYTGICGSDIPRAGRRNFTPLAWDTRSRELWRRSERM